MRLFLPLCNGAVYKSVSLFFSAITFSLSSSATSSFSSSSTLTPTLLLLLTLSEIKTKVQEFGFFFSFPSYLLSVFRPELFFISTSVGDLGCLTPAIPLICLHVRLSYYRRRQREVLMGTLFLSFSFFYKPHSSKLPIKCHIVIYVLCSDGTKVPHTEHHPLCCNQAAGCFVDWPSCQPRVAALFCPLSASLM